MIRALTLAALVSAITVPAAAQFHCGSRTAILQIAKERYLEIPVALALAADQSVIEVLASRDGETFTLIRTDARGISCVLVTGESWQTRVWQEPQNDDPES
ncbi:hypothetical protein [Minwuia sp.]|uniref:hypothetical protein n=1 Tax=Minwuia sp. TaxID=2493630 RepID=UPI003A924102